MLLANFNRKEHLWHRAVSLRQHGFLVLSNIHPKLHHRKWRNLRVTLPLNMSTVLNFFNFTSNAVNAVLRPTFILRLCYKLPSVVTFTFVQIFDSNFVFFIERRQSCRVCLILSQNSRYVRIVTYRTKISPRFERRKVEKKTNLHENWNMQTLF